MKSRRLLNALRVVAGIALLTWLLVWVKPAPVLSLFAEARVGYLLAALAMFLVLVGLLSVRLHILIGPLTGSIRATARLVLVGYFFNSFLPSGFGGDVYKVVALRQRAESWGRGLAMVTLDRLAGLSVIFIAGMAYIAIAGLPAGFRDTFQQAREHAGIWVGPVLGLGLVTLLVLGVLAWKNERLQSIFANPWARMRDTLTAVSPRAYAALFTVSVLTYVARLARFYLCLCCFGFSVPPADLVFVLFAMHVVALLPITIGGLGLQEGAIAFGLSLFGAPLPVGVAVGVLNRVMIWIAALAGGVVFIVPTARD